MKKKLFTLEAMLTKFKEQKDEFVSTLIIDDYVNLAREGNDITIEVSLEYLPAVENFARYKEKRMFFAGNFIVRYLGESHVCQRCLACYAINREKEEKEIALGLANKRLALIYKDFDQAKIQHNKQFFDKAA